MMMGKTLGPYRVLEKLGEGGMGEVYRAHDAKLNRDVALKILPAALAMDSDRLARFRREAQVLASLNHPNIAAIYGFEYASGVYALALELVEGPTLADRIARGPMPMDEAITVARQIAEALDAAHELGIVHRDLKPANIKVRTDGVVKVLDFGLAKALENGPVGGDASHSPTITAPAMTRPGTILGTAAYMSPEQAQGKPVDKRADIWAFGVVLYEMLSGRRLFAGETLSDTLASVLKDEPRWDRVPVPAQALLRRCIEKDPKRRLRDIGDAMLFFENATGSSQTPRRAWLAWSAAALFLFGFSLVSLLHFRETAPTPAPVESVRFQIQLPEKLNFPRSSAFAISPDGHRLAFYAQGADGVARVWVRDLDSLEVRLLPGTESALAPTVFWSPDSRFIAFDAGGKLKKVQVTGGPPQTICDLPTDASAVWGGAWNGDDVIVIGNGRRGLRRVSAAGGVLEPVTELDVSRQETAHEYPSFLPDGRHFLYLRFSERSENRGVYLGSLDAKPEEQSFTQLVATGFSPAYIPRADSSNGHVLFLRDTTLFAQTFDAGRMELAGDPVTVAEQVGSSFGDYGLFSASGNGRLVYKSAGQDLQLTWYDRKGRVLGTVGEPGRYRSLALSPDGKRAIVGLTDPRTANEDLWLLDLPGGESRRFTFDPARDMMPAWSPDGDRVAFVSARVGVGGVYQVTLSGSGREELLFQPSLSPVLTHWSPDGRFLIYSSDTPKTGGDLWVLPLSGERKPIPFAQERFHERQGRFSPDARWIAYVAAESQQSEIYVRPFSASPTPLPEGQRDRAPSAARPWVISKGGGSVAPRWRGDGRELYYFGLDGRVMAVDVTTSGSAFQHGAPALLFPVPVNRLQLGSYSLADVTPDGQRFLFALRVNTREELTVALNWTEGLGKK